MANVGLPDLMAAAQRAGVDPQQMMGAMGGGGGAGGGGGGGMPPMSGGGGTPPMQQGGGGGGDMAGQLMQIAQMVMSSPRGMQMVQALGEKLGMGGPQQAQVGPSAGPDPRAAMASGQAGAQGPMQGYPSGGMPDMSPGQDSTGPKGPMSTEDELAMAQKGMGAKGPQDEMPTQQDINALIAGKIDPKQFDQMFGAGAAEEILQSAGDGNDKEPDDDGDHEYR